MPATTAPPVRRPSAPTCLVALYGAAFTVLVSLGGGVVAPAARAAAVLVATAAVLWGARVAGRRRRGWALLALGVAGTIAGVGIGVPHAVKVGLTATTVAGLVTLAGGLALDVAATVVLVRRTRWWHKALAVPVGLAIVVFVVFPLSLAVLVTNAPPGRLSDDTPATVGLVYEDVSVRTTDGVRLDGWYVPSTNGAAVVLLPGAGGARSSEVDHAAVLARHGYGVLLLDPRGQGSSGGDAMLWGWYGDVDVAAGITFLAARPDVTDGRIGAVGMSMGAEEAIGAAGSDDRILAVVAEGASGRGPGSEGTETSGAGGWPLRVVGWTATQAADLMTSADAPPPMRSAVEAASPRPMLIIAAGAVPEEATAARLFQATAPDAVEVWVAPEAGHTDALGTHPVAWERRVVDFLDGSLHPDVTAAAVTTPAADAHPE